MMKFSTFNELVKYIITLPAHRDIKVNRDFFNREWLNEHKSRFADYDGQNTDYRILLTDGKSIHVKEYVNHYKIHWDKSDLATNPIGHLINDAPHYIIIIILAVASAYLLLKK